MNETAWSRRKMLRALGLATLATTAGRVKVACNISKKGEYLIQETDSWKPERPVTVIVIGAGSRGWGAYSSYGLEFPDELQVVGVAEPIPFRRQRISEAFSIPPENQFVTWEHVFDRPKIADALIIATPDHLHYGPAMAGLEAGYDLLLEKVIAQTWQECNDILGLTLQKQAIVAVCHVLRYSAYFRKMKEVVDSGRLGNIVSIQHLEPIEHIHMAHSFVRGNWNNAKKSNPIILSKSCHDTDILRWIVDKPSRKVSSFGSLSVFRQENAPPGSTYRCTDGCAVERECPFSAIKIYLERKIWLGHFQIEEENDDLILAELKNGPYGRCVFRCDNDVVDHQVTNFLFEDQVTVSFSMEAMTHYGGRRTRIFGSAGDLAGDEHSMTITEFSTMEKETWDVSMVDQNQSGHGGGDHGLVRDFVRAVSRHDESLLSSTIQASMESHLMGFKAEESRLKGTVETMEL